MNNNILLTILLSTFGVLMAQPDWEDCPGCYEFTATMTAGVYDEGGTALGDDGDILAALDADGNVRGLGTMLDGIGPSEGLILHAITIRSNAGGDIISFKYYDASEDIVLDIAETYTFVINENSGNLFEPYLAGIIQHTLYLGLQNDILLSFGVLSIISNISGSYFSISCVNRSFSLPINFKLFIDFALYFLK